MTYGRPITGCAPCDNGCMCPSGSPGCEHFACWGRNAETTCPAAEPHQARLQQRLAGLLHEH